MKVFNPKPDSMARLPFENIISSFVWEENYNVVIYKSAIAVKRREMAFIFHYILIKQQNN